MDADNDGKLTANDFVYMGRKFVKTLAYRIPSAAGFSAAFYAGFNSKIWENGNYEFYKILYIHFIIFKFWIKYFPLYVSLFYFYKNNIIRQI